MNGDACRVDPQQISKGNGRENSVPTCKGQAIPEGHRGIWGMRVVSETEVSGEEQGGHEMGGRRAVGSQT